MNIIGDIHGCYLTLKALLKQMPSEEVIALGDLIDYGPRSREVLDFFRQQGKAIKGNHEIYFIQAYLLAQQGILKDSKNITTAQHWLFSNKGEATLKSFGLEVRFPNGYNRQEIYKLMKQEELNFFNTPEMQFNLQQILKIPKEYIDFLQSLPVMMKLNNVTLGHAPMSRLDFPHLIEESRFMEKDFILSNSIVENRQRIKKPIPGTELYVYGHMNDLEVKWHSKKYPHGQMGKVPTLDAGKIFAIGLDTIKPDLAQGKAKGFLSGLHLPTMTIYQQEMLD